MGKVDDRIPIPNYLDPEQKLKQNRDMNRETRF